MRIKKVAAPMAALALAATLTTGAATSADAEHSDGARKIKTCKGKQLKVRLGKTGVAAGSTYRDIWIRNRGKRCKLTSWPRVGYASKHGTPVGFFARTNRKLPNRVVLGHNKRRKFILQTPSTGPFPRHACRPARARKIVTYVPGYIRPSTRHASKSRRFGKVCTTVRGRPSLHYRKVG
ncbi:MAG: DUF4232 domain-containing protein [Actinomycetia bacterium]|nr:DUF4232 domain-containing protein [Actinomycetes bacterium]